MKGIKKNKQTKVTKQASRLDSDMTYMKGQWKGRIRLGMTKEQMSLKIFPRKNYKEKK